MAERRPAFSPPKVSWRGGAVETSRKTQETPEPAMAVSELASRLRFEFDSGHIWLGEARMILLHGAALTALRKELIDSLGVDRARGVLLRMGYASGARDAEWARKLYPNASATELLAIGPALHMLEGIVSSRILHMTMDIAKGVFHGEFTWETSFEADAHIHLYGLSPEPACWMQLGYACGYSSTLMGRFILYKETECAAAGAPRCKIVGRPADEWQDAAENLKYFEPDSVADHILALQDQVQSLRYSIDDDLNTDDLVGVSPGFKQAAGLLKRAAHSQVTVLLLGETGVGKEMFARALHNVSPRAELPFIAINCAALPEQLIESELFGVEKGAFTGAQQSRPGRFERAHGGTLFLDEAGELSASAQAKLLRVLQEGELERIGDSRTRKVDVRVVAATNVDLEQAVEEGCFRRDLYYRLNIYPVTIPPLRERKEDIALLAQRFLEKYQARHNKKVLGITDEAMHALKQYRWPGNVRELENVIERGVILAPGGGRIDLLDLFPAVTSEVKKRQLAALAKDGSVLKQDESTVGAFLDYVLKNRVSLDDVESVLLKAAVDRSQGNYSSAARMLGMTRPQFAYRLKKHKLGTD
ncbi:MAG: sigma 54-interacting transcriptional regulator [Rhodocyclales bacterium]|nr:sigma 54-interacting transcriptional regulator [Rhodocyclales bacterium]